ncbi:hypothetical protein OUZ56_018516 [Daphnia magna]|uniref:Secreted protein n=1 Tax=Daphnia magna TaxID=35525 RepID=A0ABQ9Z946_9CRUS|nr:hypothetical protein OUZ56_018516 [Daphnia magna]
MVISVIWTALSAPTETSVTTRLSTESLDSTKYVSSLDVNIARTINILGPTKRKDSVPKGRCHPPRKGAHPHHTEHAV